MTKTQLIDYMRLSCKVQDPEVTPIDPLFLSLSDSDIESVLEVGLAQEYPEGSLDSLPTEYLYPVILVSKKELYYQLAVNSAPLYPLDLGRDGGLKKNIRFDHYMALINMVELELKTYRSTGNGSMPKLGNLMIEGRYYTNRDYNLSEKPSVTLTADSVGTTTVELSWVINKINKFYNSILYKYTSAIVDLYDLENPINENAEKVYTFTDIHETMYRVTGLTPSTTYYFALAIQERNGLKGYSEITFTTLLS